MQNSNAIDAIVAGDILFETIINKNNDVSISKPGGSALYCAAGFNLWGKHAGILSKIGEDEPESWMDIYQREGCSTSGIRKVRGVFDQTRFYAVLEDGRIAEDNPQKYFYNLGQSLPKFLLGYVPPQHTREINRARIPSSISSEDIPAEYLQVNHLIIAPMDLYTHSMLPPFYRSRTDGQVIYCGSDTFMQPAFWYEFPALVRGCSVFLTSEDQLKRLFLGKTKDLWEMVEFIANCEVETVSVYSATGNHYLYDRSAKSKYEIPVHESELIDPIGAYPTYCGGFCSGYLTHFDPLESALMGSVSASIKREGTSPLHTLRALPELARMRSEVLRDSVRKV